MPRSIADSPDTPPPPRSGWRRDDEDMVMVQQLGERLHKLREQRGLSLSDVSRLSGVPAATLSRIENSKMSPTFSVLARITLGLRCDWSEVLGRPSAQEPDSFSVLRRGEGRSTDVAGIHYTLLHWNESQASRAMLIDITARALEDAGGLIGHEGEEFCYVLRGKLALHVKDRPTEVMGIGDSAMFDSSVPHAYLDGSGKGTQVLVVTNHTAARKPGARTSAPPDHEAVAAGRGARLPLRATGAKR